MMCPTLIRSLANICIATHIPLSKRLDARYEKGLFV
jgi:hypothetical protein